MYNNCPPDCGGFPANEHIVGMQRKWENSEEQEIKAQREQLEILHLDRLKANRQLRG